MIAAVLLDAAGADFFEANAVTCDEAAKWSDEIYCDRGREAFEALSKRVLRARSGGMARAAENENAAEA